MGSTAAAGDAPAATIRIEIFSDLVCPWCYIGRRRLGRALDALHDDPSFGAVVETVSRPFLLDPTARRGRAEPVAEVYARKFGGPQRAASMLASITELAATEGLEFRLDRALRANTVDAHRLLWFALARHGAATQASLEERLMAAYFSEGGDLGDAELLHRLAVDAGIDADDARRVVGTDEGLEAVAVGVQRASLAGITSVPTFVIDNEWAIPGAQDPAVFERMLRRRADRFASAGRTSDG